MLFLGFLVFILICLSLFLLMNTQDVYLSCEQCSDGRTFKGRRGLNIHVARCHKISSSLPANTNDPSISHSSKFLSAAPPNIPFDQYLSHLHKHVKVVKRIPRGARMSLAKSLSIAINTCINEQHCNPESWQQLLTFSYTHFHVSSNSHSLTSQLKKNCNATTQDHNIIPVCTIKSHNNPYNLSKIVESKVMDGDLRNAARILFSDDTLAPNNDETLEGLREKHPSANTSSIAPNPPDLSVSALQIKIDNVLDAINSFPNGSAGGIDGISPQHIKDLISASAGDAGRALLCDLTKFCNFLLSEEISDSYRPFLFGARLCAFNKKDGGVRPIAVGGTFRRLASKLVCKKIAPHLKDLFQPYQLGFGSPGGCEAAVHAVRTFLSHDNEADVLLKVDVKNAFNCIDRSSLLNEASFHIPEAYKYIWQCYSSPSKLFYGNHQISSEVGVQQGDPLGPALFSLGIHPITSNLNSKLNVWYLDDGTLAGEADTVLNDLTRIIANFQKLNLELNFGKCEIYISDKFDASIRAKIFQNFNKIAPGIKVLNKESLHLLGAPLLEESIRPLLEIKNKVLSDNLSRLGLLNSHIAYTIIKYCLFVPKFTYILRSCPIWKHTDILENLDATLKISLEKILNLNLENYSWTQATLPIRSGGIGIRKISCIALPAFLSSVHSVSNLCSKILKTSSPDIHCAAEAIEAWRYLCPNESIPKEPNIQKLWDLSLVQRAHKNLAQNLSADVDRARLLAVSEHESGQWLHALPSANVGTLLDDCSFRIAVGLRLGARIVEVHKCPCGNDVDRYGLHGLYCNRSAGRFSRHGSINDIIKRALTTINIPSMLEPVGVFRDDGKRPDGMTLIPWERGRALVWDATCVDTLAPSRISGTLLKSGAAAEAAEETKRRKYASLSNNYIFMPLGVETFGPWGPSTKKFITKLAPRLVDVTGDKRAGSFLAQRISLAVQRGNAASVLGTLPHGHTFYLD